MEHTVRGYKFFMIFLRCMVLYIVDKLLSLTSMKPVVAATAEEEEVLVVLSMASAY